MHLDTIFIPISALVRSICFLVRSLLQRTSTDLLGFFILDLLRQDQIKDQGNDRTDKETSFHYEHDGVEEAGQSGVRSFVGEDVREPAVEPISEAMTGLIEGLTLEQEWHRNPGLRQLPG